MDKEVIAFVLTYWNTVKIVKSSIQDVKDVVKVKFVRHFPEGLVYNMSTRSTA